MVKKEKMKSEPPPPESEDEEGSDSDGSEEQYQVGTRHLLLPVWRTTEDRPCFVTEVITKARVAEDCNWVSKVIVHLDGKLRSLATGVLRQGEYTDHDI